MILKLPLEFVDKNSMEEDSINLFYLYINRMRDSDIIIEGTSNQKLYFLFRQNLILTLL